MRRKLKRFTLKLKDRMIAAFPPLRRFTNYQKLHNNLAGYQQNNWLIDEFDYINEMPGLSILEFGCGNGLFLEKIAATGKRITGLDVALSPVLKSLVGKYPNIKFIQADIRKAELSGKLPDLVVSADVMEHFSQNDVIAILKKFNDIPRAFHKIACYDDHMSHLTVIKPEAWLELFQSINSEYKILKTETRRADPEQKVVTIIRGLD